MRKKIYLLFFCICTLGLGAGGIFLLKPNPNFIGHASFVENLDLEFGVQRDFGDTTSLLKQKQTLLPHLRRQYTRFSYSIPSDLHKRETLLQQPSNSIALLRKNAEDTQARLANYLRDFKSSHNEVRLFIPNTKPLSTVEHLLVTRWEGDASRITDYARATVAFPSLAEMYQGLEEIKKSGLMILNIEDHFQSPCLGGYRDITLVFRDFANGHLGEIQLSTHKVMEFKAGLGTELFHVIRELMGVAALENRTLSECEKTCLETLYALEKKGYDLALQEQNEDSKRKVAIYSGSFDPPTRAHKEIVLQALDLGKFERLTVYVNQFGKKKYKASIEDRKKMLEIMLADYSDKVSIAVQSHGDKRTDFRKLRGVNNHLTLIIGEDSYQKRLQLPPLQIAECDELFIIPRSPDSNMSFDLPQSGVTVIPIRSAALISSTNARAKLSQGERPEEEIEAGVLSYILANNLYAKEQEKAYAER